MGLGSIPESIKKLNRFVLWRLEAAGKDNRVTKVPYTPNARKAATTRPVTWSSYEQAMSTYLERPDFFSGIGIVLGDGLMGIDLDHVITDGELSKEAREIVDEIPGYVEYSPSGTGLHILTFAALPEDRDRLKFGQIEFYDETSPRYLTITGEAFEDREDVNEDDASDAVAFIYRRVRAMSQDDPLLDKIRASKQAEKFAALYDDGDCKKYKSVSEGRAALLAILAFWTNKDADKMDAIFRRSGLFDSKWDRPQNGRTLGAIEIENACKFCTETFGSRVEFPHMGTSGTAKPTLDNLRALFEHHKIKISYDEIKKVTKYDFKGAEKFSQDNYDNACYGYLLSLLVEEDMSTSHFRELLATEIDSNRMNPVKDWITSKPWDGTDRLLSLTDTLTAKDGFPSDLKELLLEKWLLSAVAAACHDPFADPFMTRGVLVLAGEQYLGKTRWICSLAPRQWVRDALTLDPSNKDSVTAAISHWICELGELDSTLNRDIGRIKAFLTMGIDRIRMPFAPKISEFPRRTVFSASVNKPDFLVDSTGNSRFWVIPVESIDYNHNIDMQQLFAQLYAAWQHGREWWLTREENERLAMCNEDHEQRDEIYDLVTKCANWGALDKNYCDWMTPTEVLITLCKIEHPTKNQRNSCARYLRKLTGMEKGVRKRNAPEWPIPKS